jgi:hypothetical protein
MRRMFDRKDVPQGVALNCPYPLRVCPHYEEIWQEWHEWFLSTGRFPTAERRRRVVATDYPRLGAAAWPACDSRRLWDITTICALNIEMDDDYDANRSGFGDTEMRLRMQRAQAAEFRSGNIVGDLEPRWGPIFAEVWRSFSEYTQPGLMRRNAEDHANYIEGCGAIDEYLTKHGAFTDVKTYMDMRYFSLGQRMDHRFTEISLGIDLSDVIEEPLMKAIVDSEMRRTIISQDVLSLLKDLGPGGDQLENIVTLIARRDNSTLAEALAVASKMFDAEVRVFDELTEQIASTPLGQRPDVMAFIRGVNDFAAGYMDWTVKSGRYTLADTCPWWGPRQHQFLQSC